MYIDVNMEDYDSLQGKSWLTDNVVDFAIQYMFKEKDFDNKIQVVSSLTYLSLRSSNAVMCYGRFQKNKIVVNSNNSPTPTPFPFCGKNVFD